MKTSELVKYLLDKFPIMHAHEMDNGKIGLQFGSMNKDVKKVLIALDGSTAVVNEAVSKNVDFLLLHHPFMFAPMLSLNYDSPFGQKLSKIIKNDINVFAMHTNFDVANEGMNDILAGKLGLKNIHITDDEVSSKTLIRVGEIEPMKLVDFVECVASSLEEESVRYVGRSDKIIKTVGIVGGAGASEINRAHFAGCDVLVTGEVHHHQAYDAIDLGLSVIEVSHSIERHFANVIKEELSNVFPDVEFIVSENNINPFKTYKTQY